MSRIRKMAGLVANVIETWRSDCADDFTLSIRGVHEFGGHIGLFSREGAMEHRELINRDRMIQLAETSGFRIQYFRRFLSGCNQLFVLEPVK